LVYQGRTYPLGRIVTLLTFSSKEYIDIHYRYLPEISSHMEELATMLIELSPIVIDIYFYGVDE
jgi:hypothetical protein